MGRVVVFTTLLKGDAAEAVVALRRESGRDFLLLGSGELARSLMRRNIVDEYLLLIHPLVLGPGRRLFPDGGPPFLSDSSTATTPSGVVIATCHPAEARAAGTWRKVIPPMRQRSP
jgi:dihydrofolate reductase